MNKLLQYLPKQAAQRLKVNPDAVLVDVRSEAENKFVGRPLDSILLPWIDEPDWEPDPEAFSTAAKRIVGDVLDTELILICRSGYRSTDAGKCLLADGFSNVGHIVSGFEGDLDEYNQRGNVNGWRHDGMPWLQC